MRKYLAAVALAAALAQPAAAVTLPSLTTIYVGGGLYSISPQAVAAINCTNVSGVEVTVRVLLLNQSGGFHDSATTEVPHGGTAAFSTKSNFGNEIDMDTTDFTHGLINIESTESGVFCNVRLVERNLIQPNGVIVSLVRVNPHPGTVE